jgi:hypothetical protein
VIRRVLVAIALLAPACTAGARIDVSPSATPTILPSATVVRPGPDRWAGAIVSHTFHDLYVGGSCRSDWRAAVRFEIRVGKVSGRGVARRTSTGAPCAFPVAQVQIRSFRLDVAGSLRGRHLDLRLEEVSSTPSAGADDLGGFRTTTLVMVLRLTVRNDVATDTIRLQAPDGDRGRFGSTNLVRLSCRSC